jgi:hypothetical protein
VQLLEFDVATDSGQVVPSTGVNLLSLTFSATPGASGVFDVVTYGSTVGSNWVDGNPPVNPNLNASAFDNVPFASNPNDFGPPVVIGTLTVTESSPVPEPQSALLLLCAGGGALLLYHRARRRDRRLTA